jgi:hypothetical protein
MSVSRQIAVNLDKLTRWMAVPERAADIWLGKCSVTVAWVGLFVAALTPPHGSGVSLCWFGAATGIPCPGCGVTRSVSCALRGMLYESSRFHPMGVLLLMLFIFTAGQSILPKHLRECLRSFIEAKAIWYKAFYAGFVTMFISFGTTRALLHLAAECFN